MKIIVFLFIIVFTFLLNSCFVEQRIAYNYQSELHTTPILFQNSAEVYLTNSKGEFPDNISEEILNYNYDSAFYYSDLVRHIDVYDYKYQFAKYLNNNLQNNNLNVYPADSIISFIKYNEPRMIIDIIQIEVEEYYDIYYDEMDDIPSHFSSRHKYLHLKEAKLHTDYRDDGSEYYYSSIEIPRNALIVNLWLQIDIWLNDSVHNSNIVFMDYAISDNIEGKFIMKDFQNPQYIYTIDSLKNNDLWKVAELPTKIFAENIIDYLVNNIVDYRYYLKQNNSPSYNWKYKPSSGLIIPYEEELPYLILHKDE